MNTRVLVAEDDADMRQVLVYALMAVGVEQDDIVDVGRGDEAVRLTVDDSFDLMVLDWYMPGLDGMDIVRTVRALGSDVPIIMVTGEKHRDLVVAAIEGGITDYVIKPFDHDALLGKFAKYCPGSPAHQSA